MKDKKGSQIMRVQKPSCQIAPQEPVFREVRGKKLLSVPGAQWALAPPVLLLARPFGWTCVFSAGALMPRCILVCVCVCVHSTDISLAPSAPLKIRRRAERMKGDKVQNKDERRTKRRVASLLFRARTMFRPFSHALYNTLSATPPRPPGLLFVLDHQFIF